MSLDVYLEQPAAAPKIAARAIFIRENGQMLEVSREEWNRKCSGVEPVTAEVEDDCQVYWRNITHNLGKMASAAGIYEHLWRPDENGITHARQLIEPLTAGLRLMLAEPARFKAHNPENKWGDYQGLVAFVTEYLDACKANPDALVRASR